MNTPVAPLAPLGRTTLVAPRPNQVALRWLVENPLVLRFPGAKNAGHAVNNAGALTFQLTTEEVDALDRATVAWRG